MKGSPLIYTPVDVGVPQASPISPLLFVIYMAPLHVHMARGISSSYIDDVALTASSPSYHSNIRILQWARQTIKSTGEAIGVAFLVAKTDFRHWRTAKDRTAACPSPIFINGQLFRPLNEVKWLGLWFPENLSLTLHYGHRLTNARNMFFLLHTLSPPGSGLTSLNNRRLAQGILCPILLYGAGVFPPTTTSLNAIAIFWNTVLGWVTNCFHSTNHTILPAKASLFPAHILAWKPRLTQALHTLLTSPLRNPASAQFPPSFIMTSDLRLGFFRPFLPTLKPLPWTSRLNTNISQLPIDQQCVALCDLHPPQTERAYTLPPHHHPHRRLLSIPQCHQACPSTGSPADGFIRCGPTQATWPPTKGGNIPNSPPSAPDVSRNLKTSNTPSSAAQQEQL